MRPYWIDLKRGVLSLRFLAAAALCAAVYALGSLGEIGSNDVIYILDASVSFSSFDELYLIAAVLPLGASFLEDLQSGQLRFALQRVDASSYLVQRFLAACTAGALASALGMLAFLGGVVPVLHPMAAVGGEEVEAIYPYAAQLVEQGHWFSYFGLFTLLRGASGFFWGGIGLMFSAIAGRMQLVYLCTMLCKEVLCRALFALDLHHIEDYAGGQLEVATVGELLRQSLSVFAVLSLLAFAVFMLFGKRRLRHV